MNSSQTKVESLLEGSLKSGRIHSGYLFVGLGDAPRAAALRFARALVCRGDGQPPCESCSPCHRSKEKAPIRLDGKGKKGPLYRHIGDHPDLLWVERGDHDTRVRIGQIRALQIALHRSAHDRGYRVAVISDGAYLNAAAQNALLHILEEPPPQSTLLLVADSAEHLLPTVRSRCQRINFPSPPLPRLDDPDTLEEVRELADQLEGLPHSGISQLLDWAENYRGARGPAVTNVELLLETGSRWLRERVEDRLHQGENRVEPELEAFSTLAACRKALIERNANPQMIAERALFALRDATSR